MTARAHRVVAVAALVAAPLLAGAASAHGADWARAGPDLGRIAATGPGMAATGPGAAAVGRYRPPVSGALVVLRPFESPPSPYAAGHRGVDLLTPADGLALAAGDGQVSFAGPVAGRGVVVVTHPDGIRTEYEPLVPAVAVGQVVSAGTPLGQVSGEHVSCPSGCLHWGARRGSVYVDPLSLLRPLGPVRLLPWPDP
ncbi:MAG: M23 family metallopeptidase [Actinomycetia bacterium]|nr:M23 family metallopeptidase [Actinomycetes bacterium]